MSLARKNLIPNDLLHSLIDNITNSLSLLQRISTMEKNEGLMVDKEVVMDQDKYDEYNKACGLISMYRKDLKESIIKLKDKSFEFSNQSKVDFLTNEIEGYIEAADKIMYYWGAPLEKLYKEEFNG